MKSPNFFRTNIHRATGELYVFYPIFPSTTTSSYSLLRSNSRPAAAPPLSLRFSAKFNLTLYVIIFVATGICLHCSHNFNCFCTRLGRLIGRRTYCELLSECHYNDVRSFGSFSCGFPINYLINPKHIRACVSVPSTQCTV